MTIFLIILLFPGKSITLDSIPAVNFLFTLKFRDSPLPNTIFTFRNNKGASKTLNLILVKYYALKNNINISSSKDLSFRTIKNCGKGCKFLGGVSISNNIEISRFTSINGPATRIAASINKIKIGSFCSIASNVVIQEYYHKYDRITSYYINQNIIGGLALNDIFSKGDIIIEDEGERDTLRDEKMEILRAQVENVKVLEECKRYYNDFYGEN